MATKANVSLLTGPMGCGKTTFAAAVCVDAYKASKGKVKIFTNFDLFGIKHIKFSTADLIRFLNDELIKDAIVVIDEASITADARSGMDKVVVLLTQQGMTMRKRSIELYIIVQHGRMLDWRFKFITRRTIDCKYNEKTKKITALIQDVDTGHTRQLSFYAPQYWKNFDTNELPEIPKKTIERALARVS